MLKHGGGQKRHDVRLILGPRDSDPKRLHESLSPSEDRSRDPYALKGRGPCSLEQSHLRAGPRPYRFVGPGISRGARVRHVAFHIAETEIDVEKSHVPSQAPGP